MDAERYAKVRELFFSADDVPPQDRHQFVVRACGDDLELRHEVLSLLAEHDPDFARSEGDRVTKPVIPPPGDSPSAIFGSPQLTGRGPAVSPAKTDPGPDTPPAESTGPPRVALPLPDQSTRIAHARTMAVPRHAGSADRGRSRSDSPGKSGSGSGGPKSPSRSGSHTSRRSSSKTSRTSSRPPATEAVRRTRRLNSWWIALATIIPTMLVGYITAVGVDRMQAASLRSDLAGFADALESTTARFLDDQVALVQSWSRQQQLRDAVRDLVRIAKQGDSPDGTMAQRLRTAPQADVVMDQLKYLSGREDIKYVVWDRAGNTVASWLPDRTDVGNPIVQSQANGLAMVFRGEAILYGPERLVETTTGFVPETDRPVMAPIVPIRDDGGEVIAAMLVRGIGMYEAFNDVLRDIAIASGLDVYAVDKSAVMVTDSPVAVADARGGRLEVDPQSIAAILRVSDPSQPITPQNAESIEREFDPLTYAAARVSAGQDGLTTQTYRNYTGRDVVGSWRWMDRWKLGLIVERDAEVAFAASRLVRYGYLTLIGLLGLTALVVSRRISHRSAVATASLHPLSRYEILGELGSGGMGIVYHARHRQLGRDTALKVLRGDRRNREDQLRFDREARLSAALCSPHCVRIYDYGRSPDGESYCVMEYLQGLTLYEVVARGGHQSIGRTLFVLRQICSAIAEAHAKDLMHRDLKPQNVMLSFDNAVGDWAVVFDFGLAKPVRPGVDVFNTTETIWSGTPMYMAPERFRNPEQTDPRSDIYAIGCIAYFLISGHPPFAECDPESMFALILNETPIRMSTHRGEEIPDEIVALVSRCMAKLVDMRFQTVAAVAAEIDALRSRYPWTAAEADAWWTTHADDRR